MGMAMMNVYREAIDRIGGLTQRTVSRVTVGRRSKDSGTTYTRNDQCGKCTLNVRDVAKLRKTFAHAFKSNGLVEISRCLVESARAARPDGLNGDIAMAEYSRHFARSVYRRSVLPH